MLGARGLGAGAAAPPRRPLLAASSARRPASRPALQHGFGRTAWRRRCRSPPGPVLASAAAAAPLGEEAAGAAPWAGSEAAVGGGSAAPSYVPPTPLPPPPRSAELRHVLPYLLRLALGDPQLHWRLGAALALLLASKACGGWLWGWEGGWVGGRVAPALCRVEEPRCSMFGRFHSPSPAALQRRSRNPRQLSV